MSANVANFRDFVSNSPKDQNGHKKRIGTSATEIELLDDMPLRFNSPRSASKNVSFDQTRGAERQFFSASGNQQQSSFGQHVQTQPTTMYSNNNDSRLNSTIDRLLDKYAPDATPQNSNITTTNRPVTSTSNNTNNTSNPASVPPSYAADHGYSTIIRSNPLNNQNPSSRQPPTKQSNSVYDSFQHVNPQAQYSTQQFQPTTTNVPPKIVPVTTNNGRVTDVVPGRLYTLDEDPLHLLLDRQPVSSNTRPTTMSASQPQPPIFYGATFQPNSNANNYQDPLTILFGNPSGQHPSQTVPPPTTTNPVTFQPVDLESLIKRVQLEYVREIEPFVSSVKFVEKDRDYGQNYSDIGFVTPITVRKGFRKQADDILQRSFGRGNQRQKERKAPARHPSHSDDDDDINPLPTHNRGPQLEERDSRMSFTTITSISTDATYDDDDDYQLSETYKPNRAQFHDKGTSPPPQTARVKPEQPIVEQKPIPPAITVTSPSTKGKVYETPASPAANTPKLARRVPYDGHTTTDDDSHSSSDEEQTTAQYNEHDGGNPPQGTPAHAVTALVLGNPMGKPSTPAVERRLDEIKTETQRSEDIRAMPPTLSPGRTNQTTKNTVPSSALTHSDSDTDTASNSADDDDSDNKLRPRAAPATRSNISQASSNASSIHPTNVPSSTLRSPGARFDITTPQSTPGISSERLRAAPPGTTLASASANQRTTASASQLPTANTPVQTGSTRFYQNDPDANRKRGGAAGGPKESPSGLKGRIRSLKNIFRRGDD